MIPECVAAMNATHAVEMNYASTGAVAWVSLTPETILGAVEVLDRAGYLLEDVTASDLKEGIEITYHFCLFEGKSRLVLRLIVPHDGPKVPSISSVYPGADWHERECFDFFGIDFTGHPNLHFLLLPEEFTGKPPLVKAEKDRKGLVDVMPQSWLVATGLAEAEKPKAVAPAPPPAATSANGAKE
jgi:NADH-quinone oxidoreductase subunit C